MRRLLLILLSPLVPQLVSGVEPRLENILPPGGERGTEVAVRFSGQRLADAKEIVFYEPGIAVASMDPGTNFVKAVLRLAPDCALGEHSMRVRTATGISEIRTFWVGPFPVVAEQEPNSDLKGAQRLTNNVTVNGVITADDQDQFRVTVQMGRRLTAEVEGLRLGRSALDPFLAILDSAGKTLAASEDTAFGFQDGVLSIVAPETGDYIVLVRDSAFGGKEDFQYLLHVGDFPRPTAVYPLAGKVGTKASLRFVGDPGGPIAEDVQLPDRPEEKLGVAAEGAPSPNWIRVTSRPIVMENEPNDSLERAGGAHDVPVVFNGIIGKPGDRDWFKFRGKKGERLQITVFARRLRSPLDSVLQVVTPGGAQISDNDDTAGPDSSVTFKADEAGDFALSVRDFLGRGGPDFAYCVEVEPVEPGLSVKIPEVARNDTQSRQYVAVPRGNRFASLLSVRRDSAPGGIQFRVDALPHGVEMRTDTMPDKVDQFPVVFEAAADAPVDGRLVDLMAATTNGVTGHFRNDIELVRGPNNSSYYGTRVERLLVAVTEAAPFRVNIEAPAVPLVQGGTMELQVSVERDAGFEEPVNLKMVWNPPGINSQPDIAVPKGATHVSFPVSAKPDAPTREWRVAVSGTAKVDGGELMVSSRLTAITVGDPFVTATMEKATCEPGKSTNIVVKLDQKIPFDGEATIRIVGLSEKVNVGEKVITKDDREVVFPVTVAADCAPGSQRNLFCALAVKKDGAAIPHQIAQGGSFRVVPIKLPADGQRKVANK